MSIERSSSPAPPGRARRRWLTYGAEALLLLMILAGVHWWQTRDLPGGAAIPLEGVLLDGRRVSLDALRGEPVLVQFWATWCPVCKLEQASINAIARDHRVLSVAMQSGSADEVARHLAQYQLTFPVINDPDSAIAQRWRVRGVPTSFVIDRLGVVRFVEVGYTTEAGLRLRLALAGRDMSSAAPN